MRQRARLRTRAGGDVSSFLVGGVHMLSAGMLSAGNHSADAADRADDAKLLGG